MFTKMFGDEGYNCWSWTLAAYYMPDTYHIILCYMPCHNVLLKYYRRDLCQDPYHQVIDWFVMSAQQYYSGTAATVCTIVQNVKIMRTHGIKALEIYYIVQIWYEISDSMYIVWITRKKSFYTSTIVPTTKPYKSVECILNIFC